MNFFYYIKSTDFYHQVWNQSVTFVVHFPDLILQFANTLETQTVITDGKITMFRPVQWEDADALYRKFASLHFLSPFYSSHLFFKNITRCFYTILICFNFRLQPLELLCRVISVQFLRCFTAFITRWQNNSFVRSLGSMVLWPASRSCGHVQTKSDQGGGTVVLWHSWIARMVKEPWIC